MVDNKNIKPPLKWVGGKRQLIKSIEELWPKDENIKTYIEPFVGGGAVLFHFKPENAIINDVNSELINFYKVVKDNVYELIEDLKKHKNEEEYFYKIRELDRKPCYKDLSDLKKASRMHFLNKTCYNGLYRVNSSGEFNSPFGRYKNPDIVNSKNLIAISKYFNTNNIVILNNDFAAALENATKGDFVYLDPPYDPLTSSSNFTGYTKGGFDRSQQIRVFEACKMLDDKGVKFLLSNSSTDFIIDLYKEFEINFVDAKRSINSNGNNRGKVKEVLVRNYD